MSASAKPGSIWCNLLGLRDQDVAAGPVAGLSIRVLPSGDVFAPVRYRRQLGVLGDMAVDVHRGLHARVAEAATDGVDGTPPRQQQRGGVSVPKPVRCHQVRETDVAMLERAQVRIDRLGAQRREQRSRITLQKM